MTLAYNNDKKLALVYEFIKKGWLIVKSYGHILAIDTGTGSLFCLECCFCCSGSRLIPKLKSPDDGYGEHWDLCRHCKPDSGNLLAVIHQS
jgi:hypothetical protein